MKKLLNRSLTALAFTILVGCWTSAIAFTVALAIRCTIRAWKLGWLLALIALAVPVCATPVSIPLKSFFNGANYSRSLQISAVRPWLTDGTNIYAGSFINVTPSGGTNPVVQLAPNDYTIRAADVTVPLRFSIFPADGTNLVNVLTRITNGLAAWSAISFNVGIATNVNNATGTNVNLFDLTITGTGYPSIDNLNEATFVSVSNTSGSFSADASGNIVGSSLNISGNTTISGSIRNGGSLASGLYSVSFGLASWSVGDYSSTFGNSDAYGNYSFAGGSSLANGKWTATLGQAQATGTNSFATQTSYLVGNNSTALGHGQVNNNSCFAWADTTISSSQTTSTNQFCVFASGGTYLAGGPIYGNGSGLTNLAGLVFTNSANAFLTTGGFKTVSALGFVSVNIIVTNTQIVWLTNATSHQCVKMGNITGTWTNWDSGSLLVNANDSVAVTNVAGAGGSALVDSWFQALH